jgi:hypothetical protein
MFFLFSYIVLVKLNYVTDHDKILCFSWGYLRHIRKFNCGIFFLDITKIEKKDADNDQMGGGLHHKIERPNFFYLKMEYYYCKN